jgi:hypothetical protein
MKQPYEKSKDKYIAALKVALLLVLLPFVTVYVAMKEAAKEAYEVLAEVARALFFEREIPSAYSDFMRDASGKRARRERLRNQDK